MSEAHSNIGASSSHRWMNCPGSVALYDTLTERRTTDYALTGTLAHTVCELCLTKGTAPSSYAGEEIHIEGDVVMQVTDEIVEATKVYVDHVRMEHHTHGGTLIVEQSFDLSWLAEGMFGRNDAAILPTKPFGTLRIYDYKNGRKPVCAENNPQLMYYALGALGKDNKLMVETVECTIIQPNAFGKPPIEKWTISVDELYKWAYEVLLPAAKATREPNAPCVSGEWCCFCEVSHLCPVRQQEAIALLDEPTESTPVATLPAVTQLTPARLGALTSFFTSDAFSSWVKSLAAEEQSLLARGVDVPGRKLVETKVLGNRRWVSEDAVTSEFRDDLGGEMLVTKVKSPAQIEKLLSSRGVKKAERDARIAKLVTRDESVRVVVVDDDDPRATIESNVEQTLSLFD